MKTLKTIALMFVVGALSSSAVQVHAYKMNCWKISGTTADQVGWVDVTHDDDAHLLCIAKYGSGSPSDDIRGFGEHMTKDVIEQQLYM